MVWLYFSPIYSAWGVASKSEYCGSTTSQSLPVKRKGARLLSVYLSLWQHIIRLWSIYNKLRTPWWKTSQSVIAPQVNHYCGLKCQAKGLWTNPLAVPMLRYVTANRSKGAWGGGEQVSTLKRIRNIYSQIPKSATSLPNTKFRFPKQIFIIPCGPSLPMRPKARVLALISVMPKLISAVY